MTKNEFIFLILSLGWKRYSDVSYKFTRPNAFALFLYLKPGNNLEKPVRVYVQDNLNIKDYTYLDAYNELTKNG